MSYLLLIVEPSGQRHERGREAGEAAYDSMIEYARSLEARGVLAGTNMPIQKLYSEFGYPASAVVGMSGNTLARCEPLTASTCSLPSVTCGRAKISGEMKKSTRPASNSVIASGAPLVGM